MKRKPGRPPKVGQHKHIGVRFIIDSLIPRIHNILLTDERTDDTIYKWIYSVLKFSAEEVHEVLNAMGPEDLYQELYLLFCLHPTVTSRSYIWYVINWTRDQVRKSHRRLESQPDLLEEYWLTQCHVTSCEINELPNLSSTMFNTHELTQGLSLKDRYVVYLLLEGYSVRQIATKILKGKSQTHVLIDQLRTILQRRINEYSSTNPRRLG